MFDIIIRFRVVNEGLVDESTEPSLLMGVSQLIEERQLQHQQRFLDTERLNAASAQLSKKQSSLRQQAYSRLSATVTVRDPKYSLIRLLF